MQWLPGTNHLTVDSRDQHSSINLQTARETPVFHSVNPRLRAALIALNAATGLTECVIQVLIG